MTRIEFIEFLKEFKTDFDQNKENWENVNLSDFLESMIAYTEDIQGFYDNMGIKINADNIIDDVYEVLNEKVSESSFWEEDIALGIRLIMVDAFMRCKILEEPK